MGDVDVLRFQHVGRSERWETDCCSACGAQIPDSSMATLTKFIGLAAKVWFRKHNPQAEQNRKLKASTKRH